MSGAAQSARRMNRRFSNGLVVLLYACVALVGGLFHHHESAAPGGHDDCPACLWQAYGTTEVPVVASGPVLPQLPERVLPEPAKVGFATPFLPSVASRAPPGLV